MENGWLRLNKEPSPDSSVCTASTGVDRKVTLGFKGLTQE